jgi:hypothetical protein
MDDFDDDDEEAFDDEPDESSVYRVLMDGRWQLEDLYVFPHAYSQCYSFIYCLDSDLPPRDRERIADTMSAYPWRGGYNYVNLYTVLRNQIPQAHRPEVRSISYASPGWLDIGLHLDVAIQVAKAVAVLAGSAVAAAKAYATVMKYISQVSAERKRAQLEEMRLTQAQHKTFMGMCEDMAKFLGFKNVRELHEKTGNPEVSLKLLAAHYRRTSQLVEFVEDGTAKLPE